MASKDFEEIIYKGTGHSWSTYPELCKSCGFCIEKCPVKCLNFNTSSNDYLGTPTVKCQIEKCISCGVCESVCPEGAVLVKKDKK